MSKTRRLQAGLVIIWKFQVTAAKRRRFESVYGAKGEWARFFRRGKGYVRTELTRLTGTPLSYVTLDFWLSRKAYDTFQKRHRAEYAALDRKCESLTRKETLIGYFQNLS